MLHKILSLSLFLITVLNVKCEIDNDTTKAFLPEGYSSTLHQNYDKLNYEALVLIQKDSLKEGFGKLSKVFKAYYNQEHVNRIADYKFLEFVSFLELLGTNELSEEQESILLQLLEQHFLTGTLDLKKSLKQFSKHDNSSEFFLRLNVFYYFTINDNKSTSNYLTRLLFLNPNSFEGNVLKAMITFYQQKWKISKKYFDRVIDLNPLYACGYAYRGICNFSLGDTVGAKSDYLQSLNLYPNYPFALNELGAFYMKQKEVHKAIGIFKEAIILNPKFYWPYNNIGLAYVSLNQADSAILYYDMAIEQKPNDARAYNSKGDVYYDFDEYEKAIYFFSESIKLNPGNKTYYKDRGNAFFYSEEYDKALVDFEKALSLDEDYYYVYRRIGDCYFEQENYLEGLKYCKIAIRIKPNYEEAMISMALCYIGLGEIDLAISKYEEVITIYPEKGHAYENLGWIYYCLEYFQKSIECFQNAIEINDDSYYAKFNVALLNLRLGNYKEAEELYIKYYNESRAKEVDLSEAIENLKDLIKNDILVLHATYIIDNILK